ncbi:translocation/assembly module TamB domain-containing protein [Paracoccus jeotgali]|uniref:translocation/assembly module TamB domain-containing protein n=1 Tax=Paracoccus jeotgali TaxID=2065379 RepID=UPI0028B1FA45|nr:translocation/assembly module TamB domain-containing protein [Paracoccus jeotgali]
MIRRFLAPLAFLALMPLAAPSPAQTPAAAETVAEISEQTDDDQGFLTRFVQNRLSGAGRTVRIDGFRGALSSRATFDRISVADDKGVWLVLHDGAIQWTRSALLRGRVEVGELQAALIEIPRGPVSEDEDEEPSRAEARSFNLPELPVAIQIEHLNAERVELGSPLFGEEAAITIDGSMSLAGGEGQADVEIRRVDGEKGIFTFKGSFDNDSRELHVDLELDEDPNGIFSRLAGIEGRPAVSGRIKGDGPLGDFAADIKLATDGVERVSGQLAFQTAEGPEGAPGNSFSLDLGGDLAPLLPPQNRDFFAGDTRITATGWRAMSGRLVVDELALQTDALKLRGQLATNDSNAPQKLDLSVDFGEEAGAQVLPVTIPFMNPPINVLSGSLDVDYDASQGSGWQLKGWLSEIDRAQMRVKRLDLDGSGQVRLAQGETLEQVDGQIGFDASGINVVDERLQKVLGETLSGTTGFDFTPGDVLVLSEMQITGKDYGLQGGLTLDGLTSGIVLSSDNLTARHDDLSNLSELAGRPLGGSASADLTGFFQVLTGAFDVQGTVTGRDLTVDEPRLDRLLAGESQIALSAGRSQDGTELRRLAINAQRITLTAQGQVTSTFTDLTAEFDVPTLSDIDPALQGAMQAQAHVVGENGKRRVTLDGQATGLKTGVAALDGAFAGTSDLTATVLESADGGFTVTELALQNDQLALTGGGVIDGTQVDGQFDLNFSDLAALGETFGGRLNAHAEIATRDGVREITIDGNGTDLRVGQPNLNNALAGETQFSAQATQKGNQILLDQARLTNRDLIATAQGSISGSGTNLTGNVTLESLAALSGDWDGSLTGDLVLTQGPQGTRALRVEATGQDLALGPDAANALPGQTDITISAEQTPDGTLRLDSFDLRHPRLQAQASGSVADGAINGQAQAQSADLAALGRGWQGSLDINAGLTTDSDGARAVEITGTGQDIRLGQQQADAALTGTTRIDIAARQEGDGAIDVSRATITNDQMDISAQGQIGQAQTDATAQIVVRDLASLGLGLQGSLDVDARFADIGDGARRLTVSGHGNDLALGQIGAQSGTGRTEIDIAAVERGDTYVIERAELASARNSIVASGQIGPQGTDAQAQLALNDLGAFGLGMSGALNAQARLTDAENGARDFSLTGTAQDLALNQAGADSALLGETRIEVTGQEQDGVITLDTATIAHPKLSADASGRFGEGQSDLTAQLDASDLSFLGRDFGGALQAQVTLQDQDGARQYRLTGTGRDLRLGQAQADAALQGETRLEVQAEQRGGRLDIQKLQAENAQLSLSGQGSIGDGQTDFQANAVSRDLGFLGAGFGGSVRARAVLRDQGGVQNFTITGTGTNITTGTAAADAALQGETRFSSRGIRSGSTIRIDEAQARNARLTATAQGLVGGGRTDLRATLNAADLGFVSPTLRGRARIEGRVVDQPGDARRITAKGELTGLGIGNPRIDGLLAGTTRLELAAIQDGSGLRIQNLDARNPQLRVIASGNPTEALNVDARLSDLAALVPGLNGPAQAVGTIRQTPEGNRIELDLTAPGGTRARVAGLLAGPATDLRMSGVGDAALVNPLLRTRSVEGPVRFDLRMQGEPGLDALSGTLNLDNGRLAEPRIGLTLQGLNLSARLDRGLIAVDLRGGLSAGGSVSVDGNVDLRSGSPVLDLTARLNSAVIRDPSLYELTADGTVTLTGRAADGPLVGGTINILHAEIRIPSTGLGGAKAIPDIIHRNDSWQAAATRAKAGIEPYGSAAAQAAGLNGPAAIPPANPARFDLTIRAPNQVFIRGRGVDAELGGEMRLTGNARTPIPIGQLSLIRGRVDLLGKRFDLTEGLIELQGSLVPVMRLVASHTEGGILTRIIIDGDLREPDITFESVPELPQEEVLSYLLFGRGLDQISALQAAQLANAVAVLAGRGGIGVVGNIREAAGLDDLDLTVDDEGNVAVRAGKYLSRNVYTDVEVNGDGETQINLNLDLTESLTARGSVGSDGDTSIGIAFERDY